MSKNRNVPIKRERSICFLGQKYFSLLKILSDRHSLFLSHLIAFNSVYRETLVSKIKSHPANLFCNLNLA